MDTLQNTITKTKKFLLDKDLYDVRILFLLGMGVIAVTVFWNGAKIVQQNYELAQKVEAIEQENEVLRLENQNKALRNEYLSTDEFAEITARRLYGKAAPGERVYIVPKEVALNALDSVDGQEVIDVQPNEKPQYQKNFESWMNIYFGN